MWFFYCAYQGRGMGQYGTKIRPYVGWAMMQTYMLAYGMAHRTLARRVFGCEP
jgi:hypothetical protein